MYRIAGERYMLPKELLRYRIEGKYIYPKYITRKKSNYYLKIAHDLIKIFQNRIE